MNHSHVTGRRKLNANFQQLREPNSDDRINLDALLPRRVNFNRCNSRSFNPSSLKIFISYDSMLNNFPISRVRSRLGCS